MQAVALFNTVTKLFVAEIRDLACQALHAFMNTLALNVV